MKFTLDQLEKLVARMQDAEVTEVEVTMTTNGKPKYSVTEMKEVSRPLPRLKK